MAASPSAMRSLIPLGLLLLGLGPPVAPGATADPSAQDREPAREPARTVQSTGVPQSGLTPGRAGAWQELELVKGFPLDLRTGDLLGEEGQEAVAALRFTNGLLRCTADLRVLDTGKPGFCRAVLERGTGEEREYLRASVGDELIYDLGLEGWGYLRVLETTRDAVRLERFHVGDDRATLRRDPSRLTGDRSSRRIHLTWEGELGTQGPGTATYRVWRREVGEGALGALRRAQDQGLEDAAEGLRSTPPSEEILVAPRVAGREWTDADPPLDGLVEYRVERVPEELVGAAFGATLRSAVRVRPGEWPITLSAGMRINLITGEVDGERAHLEVMRPGPRSAHLRPLASTRFGRVRSQGGHLWRLASPLEYAYEDVQRVVMSGGELALYLPEGIYVRLSFSGGVAENVRLRSQCDLTGGRLLPRAPGEARVAWRAGEVRFSLGPVDKTLPHAEDICIVVEHELVFGRDDWEEIAVGAGGARELVAPVATGSLLGRYRLRHRYLGGMQSGPSSLMRVLHGDLTSADTLRAYLDQAFIKLTSEDYAERIVARGIVEEAGEAAWPRLIAALRSEDFELAAAARAMLTATSEDPGAHISAILGARAILDGITTSAPAGWMHREPGQRGLAILRAANARGDQVDVSGWLHVSSLADTDPALRALARLMEEAHAAPIDSGRRGLPYALLPPAERRRSQRDEASWAQVFARGAGALEVLEELRARMDYGDLRRARVELQVQHVVELELARSRQQAPDLESRELALRLVDRARKLDAPELLEAAEGLVGDTGERRVALERLTQARLAHVPEGRLGADLGRERYVLQEASYDALIARLSAFSDGEEAYVDVVLPPGDYVPAAGQFDEPIGIRVSGVRLLGGEGVTLYNGLRLEGARDFVIDGVRIESPRGPAIMLLEDSSIVVRNSILIGTDATINAQGSLVELDGVELRAVSGPRAGVWGVRLANGGQLIARNSLLAAGSIATSGQDCHVYLEACVVDGRARNVIQSQRTGEIVLRGCLLLGSAAALYSPGKILMENVVLAVAGAAVQGTAGDVQYCAHSTIIIGDGGGLEKAHALDVCPIERR